MTFTTPPAAVFAILAAALFALPAGTSAHEPLSTVVARGERAALASICTDGGYFLMLTAHPEKRPWDHKPLQAVEPADDIAIALRHDETGQTHVEAAWRTDALARTWSIANPRTYTRTLLVLNAFHDLHLRVWLPGDDRGLPGRQIPVSQVTAAHMYLAAIEC